jgi:aflatoxin B1 aldehyde reductase
MLDLVQKHGHNEVDTARVYGGGSSEEYLGELKWQDRGIIMETKLYPSAPRTHKSADLRKYLDESLNALKTDKIHMFYLHAPDRKTPFEETFKTLNELHKEGKFEVLGLSNFMSWETAYICDLCDKNGWIAPTVYQGVYNAIHRTVDTELFPCLRHYGIKFYAFNPLGGGYLTNRYHRDTLAENTDKGSRFDPTTNQGKSYRSRYFNDTMFDALDIIRAAAGKHNLTEAECAFRWMNHHSKMDKQ